MARRLLARWNGVVLALVGVVATIWLGATGRLDLYIHPRYTVFTMVMAIIGGVVALAAFALVPATATEPRDEGADPGHEPDRAPRGIRSVGAAVASALVIAGTAVALLVLPPQTLTSATAAQRSVDAASASLARTDASSLRGGDTTAFGVKDWAVLLAQETDPAFFAGKAASVEGFVMPASDGAEGVFVLARFVVTCCAVDAQPVGIPVALPDWQSSLVADEWVSIEGRFAPNPAEHGTGELVLVPDAIVEIPQPEQPYVY